MNNLINPNVYKHLPKVLKEALEPYSDGTQKDLVLLSSLSVVGIALPNVCTMYGGKVIYPHLYFMAVGQAASGKGVVSDCEHWLTPIQEHCVGQKTSEKDVNALTSDKYIIAAGNVTSKQLYRLLENSSFGIGIIESEADTLSNFIESEHGSFSDVLRKAFHHEPCSISRDNRNNPYNIRIANPRICIALAGTKGQLAPLMKSVENGLYSRFMCYTLNGTKKFYNPFIAQTPNNSVITIKAKEFLLPLFLKLESLAAPLEFRFTNSQSDRFIAFFQDAEEFYIARNGQDFDSVVKRHGVMFTRLAMILTVLTSHEHNQLLSAKTLFCSNKIFKTVLEIIKTTLYHSAVVFSFIAKTPSMHKDEIEVYKKLNPEFTTRDLLAASKDIYKERTAYNKLEKWLKCKIIVQVSHGNYKKISIYDEDPN